MNLLSVKDLSKMGREFSLFSNVTFGLDEGSKAALIGRNGTGKSTLLNCIAGLITPDSGQAVFNKNTGVSYLPQNPEFNPDSTIREHIFCNIEEKLNKANSEDLCEYETSINTILTMLGITAGKNKTGLDRKMGTLSGGMIKKVALAQVLVEDSKLLLLDEPTNHLDITTIAWLEDYLRNTTKSVLMVTHDRYFLDSVCSDIYELEHGKFNHYKGNYSVYLEKKAAEMEIAQNTERRIESVLRTERDWLLRGPCARGTKARARVDHIHALINRDKLQSDQNFAFEVTGRRLGGKILEISNICKNYPKADSCLSIEKSSTLNEKNKTALQSGVPVVANFSYIFKKGERIGIFGDNGSGKSTLLNIITGCIEPDSGSITKGINTVFGYYQQNPHFENTSLTVLEYIKETAEYIISNDGKTLSASQMLEQFGFEGKIQYSPVSALSGGERKRLFLVRLLMGNPNFLVLDEPTNDFDIFTMSIFESFLQSYSGCILIVSHDRFFMDKIADTLFILEPDGTVSGYTGKCSEYIQYRKQYIAEQNAKERSSGETAAKKKTKNAVSIDDSNNSKSSKESSKTADLSAGSENKTGKQRRRTFKEQKEFENLESEILKMESRKEELEKLMSGGESNHEKLAEHSKEYTEISATLEKGYERWDILSELTEY